tara:strand:- start:285 stop:500 length:216 start_codon:yes stop_codon:yes gene_type:complete
MKIKEQVVFDIREEKFRYLHRQDKDKNNKVDMVELNKRLNQLKKNNFYVNAKITIVSILCLTVVIMISLKI